MFSNFGTEMSLFGIVEVLEIEPMQEIHGNKNIRVKAQTTRRRVDKTKTVIFDHDVVHIKFWSSGAERVESDVSVGDMLLIRGEIRGKSPNIDLRSKSFEILTPDETQMEKIKSLFEE